MFSSSFCLLCLFSDAGENENVGPYGMILTDEEKGEDEIDDIVDEE